VNRRLRTIALAVLCMAAMAVAWAWHGQKGRPVPMVATMPAASAVAVPALGFVPPAAGSYQLERILPVPDGAVLDSDGSAQRLRTLTTGKVTVFSFIYTYCTDAKGCPLAYATLHALREMAIRDPALRGRVRLVSMSFDPVSDTPAMMRSYASGDASAGPVPWHFLTTASNAQLAPLLAGFGQDVSVIAPAAGARAPVLAHLLKVYLIDPAGMVREIYAPAFLHPDVLRNDIATLLQEAADPAAAAPHANAAPTAGLP
jgi:protein SCO1/2